VPPYPAAAQHGRIALDFSPDGRLLLVDAAFDVTPGGEPPSRISNSAWRHLHFGKRSDRGPGGARRLALLG